MTEDIPLTRKIKDGIIIDHIIAGKAFLIAEILGLEQIASMHQEGRISMGCNYSSKRHGRKDIIKIEYGTIPPEALDIIALISPSVTINYVTDYKVIDKRQVQLPQQVGNIVLCPDSACITNHEEVQRRFSLVRKEPLTLRCDYCETRFYGPLIRFMHQNRR